MRELLLFGILFIWTAPACTAAGLQVAATATPTELLTGLTRDVSVNCSLPPAAAGTVRAVISLILSRADMGNDGVFSEIASLTEYSNGRPDVRNVSQGGVAAGSITPGDADGAFLQMTWRPNGTSGGAIPGNYRCEAFGVDFQGHPQTSQAIVTVVEKPVDVQTALAKVNELYERVDQLENFKEFSTAFMKGCSGGSTTFSAFGGSYYILTEPLKLNSSSAQTLCRGYGGVVAELNSQQEYDHLEGELKAKLGTSNSAWVMLGATDLGHEGSWTFLSSGNKIDYVNWGSSFSDNGQYNCMFFHISGHTWQLEDGHCAESNRRVFCEIKLG